MKLKIKLKLFISTFLLGLFFHGAAYALAVETPASHAILIDLQTNTVFLNKNADERMPTSSMSKTMSLYVVFDALKQGQLRLDDEFTVSEKAWRMEGSKMFIKVGTKVKVEDLIRGVAIQSGNDATVALAEGIAGTEEAFVERMNIRAKELGMNNSHFMNSSGWPDPEHYSTPRDLALLAQHIIQDFPEYYHYFAEREFTYNKIKQPNRDPLLGRVSGADGIKTGHTEVAGYGMIGSAIRDGRRLVLVVNGLADQKARADESARLIEWGFRNFQNQKVVTAGEVVDTAKVWLGVDAEVPLAAGKDLILTLPAAKRRDIKLTTMYQEPLQAPIKQGDVIAKLRIEIPDQEALFVDLQAAKDIPRKGLFGRVMARFKYLIGSRG
jgi:D-alanyl-D-alanine carboxypeptidase (penicillin-binding protein 5/6)